MKKSIGYQLHPKDIFTALILTGTMILIGMGRDGLVHNIFEITVAVAIGEKIYGRIKK